MSAWVVSKAHIDVLVNALAQHGLINPTDASTIGAMLWEENMRSVDARYNEHNERRPYTATLTEGVVQPIHAIAAARCYDYQSCEHGGWDDSEARRLIDELLAKVEEKHPGATRLYEQGSQGFRDKPGDYQWGYESLDQALAS